MGFGHSDWVDHVRRREVATVIRLLQERQAGGRVLEIGAACGFQARLLREAGYDVYGVDVAGACGAGSAQAPVVVYDGHHLPFADASFDVLFSSNVLEHIPHLEDFLRHELPRVVKPGGLAIHVVPSATWRFWTCLTYYPELFWKVWRRLRRPAAGTGGESRAIPGGVLRLLLPTRHGEHGTILSEMGYFSRWRWQRLFEESGWPAPRRKDGDLWYTGYGMAGQYLPLSARQTLARWLGSATHLFWMQKE